ncbi:MAG: hypothetical protein AAFP16_20030 [Pseudomonadota bacterium]
MNNWVPPGGTAGQPPAAPPGGGFTATRGRGLPLVLHGNESDT